MSNGKRFWLPNQKGTELFPNVYQAPAKLVIRGVPPESPLYRAVADRYAGRLKSFHAKAQQNYALSDNRQSRISYQWGEGARATYTNQFGQETLELEVSTEELAQMHEELFADFWDFALIELVVPNFYEAQGAFQWHAMAHLTTPVEQKIEAGITWPVNGLAANFKTKVAADTIINAAESDDSVRTVTNTSGDDRIFSVTVDLRPVRGLSAATVDLHAFIRGVAEVLPSARWFCPSGVEVSTEKIPHKGSGAGIPLTAADYDLPMSQSPHPEPITSRNDTFDGGSLADILSTDGDGFRSGKLDYPGTTRTVTTGTGASFFTYTYPLPIVRFSTISKSWVFQKTDSAFYDEYLGSSNVDTLIDTGLPPPSKYESFYTQASWRHWYIRSSGYVAPYSGPNPIPAEVQVTMFKGVPPLSVSNYADLFYRWDFTQTQPRRPDHTTPGKPGIPAGPDDPFIDDPAQLYGLPKLGTVILPLKMPIGPSWQPA